MSADTLLSRLDGVKRTGENRWKARCPAHNDRHPSLAVRELDDGRLLIHCFAGCDVHSVLSALSLEMEALFPRSALQYSKGQRRPFPAIDVLHCIAFEALVVATAGASFLSGQPFSEPDRKRLLLAVNRVEQALTAAGLIHE